MIAASLSVSLARATEYAARRLRDLTNRRNEAMIDDFAMGRIRVKAKLLQSQIPGKSGVYCNVVCARARISQCGGPGGVRQQKS